MDFPLVREWLFFRPFVTDLQWEVSTLRPYGVRSPLCLPGEVCLSVCLSLFLLSLGRTCKAPVENWLPSGKSRSYTHTSSGCLSTVLSVLFIPEVGWNSERQLFKDLGIFPIVTVAAVKCSSYSCRINFKQLLHLVKLLYSMLLSLNILFWFKLNLDKWSKSLILLFLSDFADGVRSSKILKKRCSAEGFGRKGYWISSQLFKLQRKTVSWDTFSERIY